jgi:O-antigen ligase
MASNSVGVGQVGSVGGVVLAGRYALVGAFFIVGLGVFWLAANAPSALVGVPALVVGAGVYALAVRHPAAHLVAVLVGVLAMLGFDPGLQVREVGYAAYYTLYIWLWLFSRLVLMRRALLKTALDYIALVLFAVGSFGAAWGLFLGNPVVIVATDWLAWIFLGLYFPVKEVCARYRLGPVLVMGAYGFVLAYVAVRNAYYAAERFGDVSFAYQITRGRVVENDSMTYASAVLAFAFVMMARSWRSLLGWLVVAGIALAGLILTQGRGYWLAFILAALAVFVVVPARMRVRWVTIALTTFGSIMAVGFLLFSDLFLLFVSGIVDRFLSIGSATSSDISLVNRFYESAAVREATWASPVLGLGVGAVYEFYDIIVDYTDIDNFVHNGYLSLWFRLGLVGLFGMLAYWWRSIWLCLKVFREENRPHFERTTALFLGAVLTGFVLSAYTSNPFILTDTLYQFGIFGGLAAGLAARGQ